MGKLKDSDHQSFVENCLKSGEEKVKGKRRKMPHRESIDVFEALVLLSLPRRLDVVRTQGPMFNAL